MRAILGYAKPLASLLILALLSLSLPQHPARAAMISTESAIASSTDRPESRADRDRVRAFLDREEVRAQIQAYGLDPDEAMARVDSLTDREIALIAGKLDRLPAGGNSKLSSNELELIEFGAMVALVALIFFLFWGINKLYEMATS